MENFTFFVNFRLNQIQNCSIQIKKMKDNENERKKYFEASRWAHEQVSEFLPSDFLFFQLVISAMYVIFFVFGQIFIRFLSIIFYFYWSLTLQLLCIGVRLSDGMFVFPLASNQFQ